MIELNTIYNLDAINFLEQVYEDYGDKSIHMFLVDFPYTFKGKNRVTANKWDLPVDINKFFDLAWQMITDDGAIVLTATNPFASYLVMNHLDKFKYEWIWEKEQGSNFANVNHQPFRVHEQILIFSRGKITYTPKNDYMKYNPQKTEGKPYKMKRNGRPTQNLATSEIYKLTDGEYDGFRHPRSIQQFFKETGLHPTQKPTSLFEYLIKTYTDEGDIVVDCCAGSGTTAIACLNTNRNYIINDLEYKYVKIIRERIKNEI